MTKQSSPSALKGSTESFPSLFSGKREASQHLKSTFNKEQNIINPLQKVIVFSERRIII